MGIFNSSVQCYIAGNRDINLAVFIICNSLDGTMSARAFCGDGYSIAD